MNTQSLRFRLIIWYAGLVTGVFLLFSAGTCLLLRHYLVHSLAESLARRIEQISVSLLPRIDATGERYVADEIKARYAPENYDRYIRLTREGGHVIFASGRAADFDPEGLPAARFVDATEVMKLTDHTSLLVMEQVYKLPTGKRYAIDSGAPMQPVDSTVRRLMLLLLLGVPMVGLVAVGGGYFLVGRALGPVLEIARSAEHITLHNLNDRLPLTNTGDELEQLSLALNRMIVRLREAFEQNRRFLADASHELRTPLTALRAELESVVEEIGAVPARDRIGSALEEVDRLAKIVETLFAISRLEAGEAKQDWKPFDLSKVATSTVDQMVLLAEDKGIKMSCTAENNVTVEGDQSRIKQVIVNLLDNAIKHTPAGGRIQLEVRSQKSAAIMEVSDTGIGIPAAALPHVFERFYRVDEAHSRAVDGAGLGLAIVKSICHAHGGKVEVESTQNRGSRFRIELPLAGKAQKNG